MKFINLNQLIWIVTPIIFIASGCKDHEFYVDETLPAAIFNVTNQEYATFGQKQIIQINGNTIFATPKNLIAKPGDVLTFYGSFNTDMSEMTFILPDQQKITVSKEEGNVSVVLGEFNDGDVIRGSAVMKDKHDKVVFSGTVALINLSQKAPIMDSVDIDFGEQYEIPYSYGNIWFSGNNKIASVSGNTINTIHAGTTEIFNNEGEYFTLNINPTLDFIKTPCLEWGCSRSVVLDYMDGFILNEGLSNEYSLHYKVFDFTNFSAAYEYNFNTNGLETVEVLLGDSNNVSLQECLNQRYVYNGLFEGYESYISPDYSYALVIVPVVDGWIYRLIYGSITINTRSEKPEISKEVLKIIAKNKKIQIN